MALTSEEWAVATCGRPSSSNVILSLSPLAALLSSSTSSRHRSPEYPARHRNEPTMAISDLLDLQRKAGAGVFRDGKELVRLGERNRKVHDDDVLADRSESLEVLKELVKEKRALADGDQQEDGKEALPSEKNKWDLTNSPHAQFGKTIDDTYRAFLAWARVREGFGKEEDYGKINISRAMRRLESYADLLHDNDTVLTPSSLEAESVRARVRKWDFRTSVDAEGRLVWWVDTDRVDLKDFSDEDYLQTVAWYAHAIMYHEASLENGFVVVQNLNHIGISEALALFPPRVGRKVSPMVMGAVPIQLKCVVHVEAPRWLNFFAAITVGMSKKLKEVLLFLDDWSDVVDWFGGLEGIPKGWGKLE
ncbi:hypothetical protein ACHAWF_009123, partial [Thalassiosira exigua]